MKDKFNECNGKNTEKLSKSFRKAYQVWRRLCYLKESGRWKELEGFKNKTFEQFVEEEIGMDLKDYDHLRFLFGSEGGETTQPEPASYWGPKAQELEKNIAAVEKKIVEIKGEKTH